MAHRPGLRERKKIQTRQAIRHAAYRLFAEHGYDATPVDRIAAAADVSTSTVFRYFPTKEDIVLTDEYDEALATALRERPPDEPPVASLRHVLLDLLVQFGAQERSRLTLIRQVPALRARTGEGMAKTAATLGAALAERSGRAPDDLEVRVVVGAVLGALREAVFYCVDHQRIEDMEQTLDRALQILSRGLPL